MKKRRIALIKERSIDEQENLIQKDLDRKGDVGFKFKGLHPKIIFLLEKGSCERNVVVRKVDDVE